MAPKRPRDHDATAGLAKKPRTAFKVGPDNLPDGTWRRKAIKIKRNLIHKAKVKKAYAKLKAREPLSNGEAPKPAARPHDEPFQALHPERQAMLEASPELATPRQQLFQPRAGGKSRHRPAPFEKEIAYAQQQKAAAEARRVELDRRDRERRQKNEERERFRRAMAKARSGGKNGQRKLGRESKVLLERVRKLVGA